mgnify:CR=1 FL=1
MPHLLLRGALFGAQDEIKQLPGWNDALPSRHFSGYLQVPGDYGNKYYHYWCACPAPCAARSLFPEPARQPSAALTSGLFSRFVESESNPEKDPVGLWLNGGPGSSSLIGMLTENGPFMTNEDSLNEALPYGNHTVPKLFHREYSWVKSASFIYLESPASTTPLPSPFCPPASSG